MIEITPEVLRFFFAAIITFNFVVSWRTWREWKYVEAQADEVDALQNETLELMGLTNAVKAEYEAALLRANDLRQQLESGIAIANGEAWKST